MQELIFKFIDFIQGNQIKKQVEQIRQANEIQDIEQIKLYHKNRVEKLLKIAKSNTDFYKNYKDVNCFSEFPVINKNLINNNKDAFVNKSYKPGKLKKVTTSGSTGVPFLVYHNPEKIKRQIADNYYFSKSCGHNLGQKLYFIRIWNEINDLGKLQKFLKNIVQVDTKEMNKQMVQNLLKDLQSDNGKKSILAYSSSLEAIAQIIRRDNIKVPQIDKLACVITMAEALNVDDKIFLENELNTKIYSRYSNSENGFLAHQTPYLGSNYKINNASFKIEVLDLNSDVEVPNGQLGRIVITDLYNYALPMIRYDTGDIGAMQWIEDEEGKKHMVLSKIEGRKLDFISFENKLISPHSVDYALRTFDKLKQFQLVVKKDKTFELLLNSEYKLTESECEEIIQRLKEYIGENAVISIRFLNDIPLLSSGKRKIVKVED